MASLTINNRLLRLVTDTITPAGSDTLEEGAAPSSFVETMRIARVPRDGDEAVLHVTAFICTDGFRCHTAEIPAELNFQGDGTESGSELVLPITWVRELAESSDDEAVHDITATYDHSWWTVSCGESEATFQISVWPPIDKLINDEIAKDTADAEHDIGFNLDYFTDLIQALDRWREEITDEDDEVPSVVPLRVHRLSVRAACHFSLANDRGTLRVLLMPVVL